MCTVAVEVVVGGVGCVGTVGAGVALGVWVYVSVGVGVCGGVVMAGGAADQCWGGVGGCCGWGYGWLPLRPGTVIGPFTQKLISITSPPLGDGSFLLDGLAQSDLRSGLHVAKGIVTEARKME
eukprot:GHVN01063784.1.p2 GENE.GHVN01063784.1~~GHVN01063784.1.p2  ORF type:complete len:123 (+),score=14.87 GHVN01063784.1:682-1050(+)